MHYILFTMNKFSPHIISPKELRHLSGFQVNNLSGHFNSGFIITIVDIDNMKMIFIICHYINVIKMLMKICTIFYNMPLGSRHIRKTTGQFFSIVMVNYLPLTFAESFGFPTLWQDFLLSALVLSQTGKDNPW